jgi:hypothetical protein
VESAKKFAMRDGRISIVQRAAQASVTAEGQEGGVRVSSVLANYQKPIFPCDSFTNCPAIANPVRG